MSRLPSAIYKIFLSQVLRRAVAICLLAVLWALPLFDGVPASAQISGAYDIRTGEDFIEVCVSSDPTSKAACLSFVHGLRVAAVTTELFISIENGRDEETVIRPFIHLTCIPDVVTTVELRDVVLKLARNNTARSIGVIFVMAAREEYPCV